MALDPERYDVKAFEAARAKFNKDAKQGKVGTFDVSKYLLPGATPDKTANVTGYDPRFGGIPGVPDPVASAGDAIGGNLTNFDDLAKLTGKTNALNFDQYTGRLPGYSDMSATSSSNILSNLRGELPPDVVNMLGTAAAERGVGGGVSGSQFSNADYLRSLGLTSLDLKSKGETGFTGAMDRLKAIPTFDPTSMFTKPEDVYTADLNRNVLGSAPNPAAAAANNLAMAKLPFATADRTKMNEDWLKSTGRWNTGPSRSFGF